MFDDGFTSRRIRKLKRKEDKCNVKKIQLPARFEPVLRAINEGKENATTVSDISKITGYDKDVIRHIVSVAVRKYGLGIATSRKGYYYISNKDEQKETYRNL